MGRTMLMAADVQKRDLAQASSNTATIICWQGSWTCGMTPERARCVCPRDEWHVERGRRLNAAQAGWEQDQAVIKDTVMELWLGHVAAWPCLASSVCLPAQLPWRTAARHSSEDPWLWGKTDHTGARADVWLKRVPGTQFFAELSPQGLSLTQSCLCCPGDFKVCGLSAPAVEIQL